MAQIGLLRDEPSLISMALEQLRARRALFTGDSLALRLYNDGRRTFINWARAVAWYLLGLARTLALLPSPPADLRKAFAEAAQWAVRRQNGQACGTLSSMRPKCSPITAAQPALRRRSRWA